MLAKAMMSQIHGSSTLPWFTLCLTAVTIALFMTAGPAPELLIFARGEISNGEEWRLVTGHLVHSDLSHALWDILAFTLLGSMLEAKGRAHYLCAMVASLLFLNGWLWWGLDDLTYYCGLSGINNTLFVLLLYQLWQEKPNALILFCGIGYTGKLSIESLSGQALFTNTAWPSLPSVHIVGAAVAVIYILLTNQAGAKSPTSLR